MRIIIKRGAKYWINIGLFYKIIFENNKLKLFDLLI